ncbi:DUF3592 domain-containing protein [Chondromyces crocatus]|uniref:DUF3592 domain-containing protein n=1 Tax=Chondromyces crocatus TaxID=52 RepID=A0A0K1EII4_CHOCO|nr:DUF3592 domain-containing protein [Chondromyces crocatus]AKT40403.1 uncharacterized protein CMC5_045560 [Chondromyces crocatus]
MSALSDLSPSTGSSGPYREAHLRVPRAPRAPSALARELIFACHGSRKTQLFAGAVLLVLGLVVSLLSGLEPASGGDFLNDHPLLFYGVGWSVGGVSLLVLGFRARSAQERAFRHGLPAPGRLLRRDFDKATSIGNKHPFEVVWEFDAHGTTHIGRLSHLDRSLVERALEGKELTVLYDPADPSANTLWID